MKSESKNNVMTELSLQRHGKKDHIQIRIEPDLKYVWGEFCRVNSINSSEILRKWIFVYLQKKGAIKSINIAQVNYDNIEDMPVNAPSIMKTITTR